MSPTNPYSTPGSSLSDNQLDRYEPKLFAFSGRIGRLRYLAYLSALYLLMGVAFAVLTPAMPMFFGGGEGGVLSFVIIAIGAVLYIAIVVLSFAFGRRRLNDLNRSGWWMLLFIIPIISLLLVIYMIFFPGSETTNDFGPAPAENGLIVKILGWILPVIFIIGIGAAIAVPAYHDYLSRVQ